MISIDHLLIAPEVIETRFSCDLKACKGACCTLSGGGGAPVADAEVSLIQEALSAAREYLSAESKNVLDAVGPLAGAAGHWETSCIDNKACVFVAWEGSIATCSFEKAWHAGTSTFRKPLSCHLFPIRVENFGGPYLRYEEFDECAPGREHGKVTNTPLVLAVKDAITRAYGAEVANELLNLARHGMEGAKA